MYSTKVVEKYLNCVGKVYCTKSHFRRFGGGLRALVLTLQLEAVMCGVYMDVEIPAVQATLAMQQDYTSDLQMAS